MNLRFIAKTAVCGLALLLLKTIVQACGPLIDPYDYFPTFFDNQLVGRQNTDFLTFRYSIWGGTYYSGWKEFADGEDVLSRADTADGNRTEWAIYAGGLPLKDVDSFVYRYPQESLIALYGSLERGLPAGSTDTHEGNAMTVWFRKGRDLEALAYLIWAKKVEAVLNGQEGDWEASSSPDSAGVQSLIRGSEQLLSVARKPFIKQRYGYQISKLLFYGGNKPELLRRYESLAAGATGNIATRMLSLKAGALYRTKQSDEAAYLFSRVFSAGPEWRHSAFISYGWCGEFKNTAAVLAKCRTPEERAVVNLIHGLHETGSALPQLYEIMRQDATTDGVEALFTREINKAEERYLGDKVAAFFITNIGFANPYSSYYSFDDYSGETKPDFRPYVEQLADFSKLQVRSVPAEQQGYWHLATAYLAFIQNKSNELQAALALAEKSTLTPVEQGQLSMMHLLQIAKQNAPVTTEAERKMLPYLRQLDLRRQTSPSVDGIYRDFVGGYLSGKYLAQGDSVKALFALARVERDWSYSNEEQYSTDKWGFMDNAGYLLQQLSPADFAAVKAFPKGTGRSDYNQWLAENNPYPVESLYELEGTRNVRNHQFAEAVKWYEKVPQKEFQKRLFPDPFHFNASGGLNDEVVDSATALNRFDFAKKMVTLQGRKDAAGMFEYGLGLWGMSYFGPAHRAYDYYWHAGYSLTQYEAEKKGPLLAQEREYFGAYAAEKVFVQVATATTDKDLKAKAFFMAAQCWLQSRPLKKVKTEWGSSYYERDYENYAKRSPYFKLLKAQLAGTPVYDSLRRQCSYFGDYVKGK